MKPKKKRKTKIRSTKTSNVGDYLIEYLKMQKPGQDHKFCPHCGQPYRRGPLW